MPDSKLSWFVFGFLVLITGWAIWLKATEPDEPAAAVGAREDPSADWVLREGRLVHRDTSEPYQGKFEVLFDGAKTLVEWEHHYVDGRRHGPSIEYFPTPAKRVKTRANYVEGKRQGEFTKYYFSGIRELEGTTVDGFLSGLVTHYAPDGTVTHRLVYERGSPSGTPAVTAEPELFEAPEPEHDETQVDLVDPERPALLTAEGEPFTGVQVGKFHGSGAKAFEHHYVGGREDGMHQGWSPAGELEYQRPFLDRRPHGTWKDWGAGGQLMRERHFHHGLESGTSRSWFPDGTLRTEGAYVHGAPHGVHREFDPGGLLRRELTYDHGVLVFEKEWRDNGELAKEVATPMIAGGALEIPAGPAFEAVIPAPGVPRDADGEILLNVYYRLATPEDAEPPPADAARPFAITLLHDGEPREFNRLRGVLGGGWQQLEWAVSTTPGEQLEIRVEAEPGELEIKLAGIHHIDAEDGEPDAAAAQDAPGEPAAGADTLPQRAED